MPLQGLADWEKDMYYPAWRGSGGNTGGISQPGFSMTWPEVPTVANPAYSSNPAPISGQGPFGKVPGPVGLPDPYADLGMRYDDLGGTNKAVSNFIRSELGGQLSPETQANLWDIGARFGQNSGMPLSGLAKNRTARDLGLATEQMQRAGLQDYLNAIFGLSKTQVNSPELQYRIASDNAEKSSAPDPTAQQSYAQSMYDKYLRQASGPAGGTGVFGGGFMGPNVGGVPFIMSNSSTPSNTSTGSAFASTPTVPSTPSTQSTAPSIGSISPFGKSPINSAEVAPWALSPWYGTTNPAGQLDVTTTPGLYNPYPTDQQPYDDWLYDPSYGMNPEYFG